jgi:hypothetical protein
LLTGGIDLGDAAAHGPFASPSFGRVALGLINSGLPTEVGHGGPAPPSLGTGGHIAIGGAIVGWIVVQVGYIGWVMAAGHLVRL